jgi:hypothetical protein
MRVILGSIAVAALPHDLGCQNGQTVSSVRHNLTSEGGKTAGYVSSVEWNLGGSVSPVVVTGYMADEDIKTILLDETQAEFNEKRARKPAVICGNLSINARR